jgi:hypothetical protein
VNVNMSYVTLDRVCLELLDDKIQAGYVQDAEHDMHAAAVTWLGAWADVLRMCDATGISSIEEFDERFSLTQSLHNWCQDLEMALENAGQDDGELRQALIEFGEESLRRFPGEDQLTIENRRRALGGAYFDAGMTEKAEELFGSWLDADPGWGFGWIGWADCYLPWGGRAADFGRAERIYCSAATASPGSGTGTSSRIGCRRYARTLTGPTRPGSTANRPNDYGRSHSVRLPARRWRWLRRLGRPREGSRWDAMTPARAAAGRSTRSAVFEVGVTEGTTAFANG